MYIPKLKIFGALFLGALFSTSSKAQFANLLLENPLTLTASYTVYSESTTQKGAAQITATTPQVVRLTQQGILADLQASGIIPAGPLTGWGLVTVRPASARQGGVRGTFSVYAKNSATGAKIRVPDNKFAFVIYDVFIAPRERVIVTEGAGAVPSETYTIYEYKPEEFLTVPRADQYIEVNQGNYVHSSKGLTKTLIRFGYLPKITIKNTPLTVNQLAGSGYMTTSFKSNNAPVFYYGIIAQTGSITGAFNSVDSQNQQVTGEYSAIIKIGASKLIAASEYPEVVN